MIAFVLGADLAGPHVTSTEVLAATAGVAAAVEVLDPREADGAPTVRFLLGLPVPVSGIDLRLVGVVMERGGDVVATASGPRRWVTRPRPSAGWCAPWRSTGRGCAGARWSSPAA